MNAPTTLWLIAFIFCGLQFAASAQEPWLTDDRAREVAGAAIHSTYPKPCYSTYRDERLESFVLGVRKNQIAGNHLNNSVYIYRVSSDVCEYVASDEGKTVLRTQVTSDCCEYGLVVVDRVTAKSYWFGGNRSAVDAFKDLVRDEKLCPDVPTPTLFAAMYRELVWGTASENNLRSLWQLQDVVRRNFQSAYSPYERDDKWQRKFHSWWRQFRSRMPQLQLDATYEQTSSGTVVRGYAFSGFQLTTPRGDPPPKGAPKLYQWALLVKADGTVEEQPSKAVYSSK